MDFKFGDRVIITDKCPLLTLRGREGRVIGEYQGGEMIEVKVNIDDIPGPFRFYPRELMNLTRGAKGTDCYAAF